MFELQRAIDRLESPSKKKINREPLASGSQEETEKFKEEEDEEESDTDFSREVTSWPDSR